MFLLHPKPAPRRKPSHRFPKGLAKLILMRDQGCIAPYVDGLAGPCSGRLTIQHVKKEVGMVPRIHTPEMLLTLCEGHHLGMQAGANWATSHMDHQRSYLAKLYPDFWHAP